MKGDLWAFGGGPGAFQQVDLWGTLGCADSLWPVSLQQSPDVPFQPFSYLFRQL